MKSDTKFKKGNVPWSKLNKDKCKSNSGSFKKGIIPHNKLPIGSVTIRNQKGDIRRWIKVEEPNKGILYSNFVWFKNNGIIPKG